MRRLVAAFLLSLGLLGGGLLGGGLLAAPAHADGTQSGDQVQQCLDRAGTEQIARRGIPSCRQVDGEWVPYWTEPSSPSRAPFVLLVLVFVAIALAWEAVPVVLAYRLAAGSSQSTGLAVALTVMLGWVGLLAVYLMSRPDGRAGAHAAVDAFAPPPGPPAAPADGG